MIDSCCVITKEANVLVRPISERMPVIIMPEDYDQWLDPEFENTGQLGRLMQAFPVGEMIIE